MGDDRAAYLKSLFDLHTGEARACRKVWEKEHGNWVHTHHTWTMHVQLQTVKALTIDHVKPMGGFIPLMSFTSTTSRWTWPFPRSGLGYCWAGLVFLKRHVIRTKLAGRRRISDAGHMCQLAERIVAQLAELMGMVQPNSDVSLQIPFPLRTCLRKRVRAALRNCRSGQ